MGFPRGSFAASLCWTTDQEPFIRNSMLMCEESISQVMHTSYLEAGSAYK